MSNILRKKCRFYEKIVFWLLVLMPIDILDHVSFLPFKKVHTNYIFFSFTKLVKLAFRTLEICGPSHIELNYNPWEWGHQKTQNNTLKSCVLVLKIKESHQGLKDTRLGKKAKLSFLDEPILGMVSQTVGWINFWCFMRELQGYRPTQVTKVHFHNGLKVLCFHTQILYLI